MKDTEKLRIVRNNLRDGLHVPFNPLDDNYALSDLRVKLNIFDFALEGLKDKSSHSVVEHEDIINIIMYWLNIYINLEHVLPLLEYAEEALDPKKNVVELEDYEHYEFSITRIKGAIDRYRKRNATLLQVLEKEGSR